MKKRVFALTLALVLCLGMSMSVFAGNNSPSANGSPNGESQEVTEVDGLKIYKEEVHAGNVQIAAGGGSIVKITDEEVQAMIGAWKAEWDSEGEGGLPVAKVVAFDVQGVKSGQVTVQLKDEEGFAVKDYIGHLVMVLHYDGTGWEPMDKYAVIDEKGCLTFEFKSYSPIILSILEFTIDDLTEEQKVSEVQATTYAPKQALVETAPEAGGAKAPKTGDSAAVLYMLLIGACAACGAYALRRKGF